MNNQKQMPVAPQNNSENLYVALSKLGFKFTIDEKGVPHSQRSTIYDLASMISTPELIKIFKGGWFISDDTMTKWVYIVIKKGKIDSFIPVTYFFIKAMKIINYHDGIFDFICLEYSTNTEHTNAKKCIINYKNYDPNRITRDIKGLPYISESGKALIGSLVYYSI
ncbi:hypothetical protein [Ruminococcus sp.]|uniref:hypothetical protein n=1 Tax=Ruminococcus sp. TaxID=41978 RepID=UPI0025F27E4A|nr:hypothetical protein [Ruminococcus sp.]